MEIYMWVIYGFLTGWAVFSISSIIKVWTKSAGKFILSAYDSIPTVFTTLGVLGTFLGIYFGLQDFDVNNVTEGIPTLLEGLKTAFKTSIIGIVLSLIFGRLSQYVLKIAEEKSPSKPTGELAALQEINKNLSESRKETNTNLQTLNKSLIGESDDSVATQFVKLRNQFSDLQKSNDTQNETLNKVQQALGGDEETSLLTQIQKLRAEQTKRTQKTIVTEKIWS